MARALAKIGLPQLDQIEQLADDPAKLKDLLGTCRHALLALALENDGLRKKLFGRKSEKLTREEIARQLTLFSEWSKELAEDGPEPEPEPLSPEVADELTAQAAQDAADAIKPRRRPVRRPQLPDNLATRRVRQPVPADERACPACGEEMTKALEPEQSERLEWVAGHFERIIVEREKLGCRCHGAIVTAPVPASPIAKGLPGPALLAKVVVDKYLLHLPLYRQALGFILEHGVGLPIATLCGWVRAVATLARPIYDVMVADVLRSRVIHTDDTAVRVQVQHSESETGKVRLWPYLGDEEHPHVVFDFTTSRKRDGPARFLADFKGYLQADAYTGYDRIFASGDVVEVACWAHARRYFYDARELDPRRTSVVLSLIDALYAIERRAKRVSPAARVALRQRESSVVLSKLHRALDQFALEVLPKGPVGKAITYVTNQWDALTRFVEDAALSIDNNSAERAVRPIAVGRRNWLFVGSDNAGRDAAVHYSLIASCIRLEINPIEYLTDMLRRAPELPTDRMWELTPLAWRDMRTVPPAIAPSQPSASTTPTSSGSGA